MTTPRGLELAPETLWRLGYRNFTRQQVKDALHEIYEALELAVGTRLANQMNKRQLDEFERLSISDQRALAWLEKTIPNYKQVVQDEYDLLLRRLEGAITLARRQHRDRGVSGEDRS
ncbi:DUF5663 domain-containing protein [Micromonospora sp. DT15]|uniref:DUF5663 domain-containing protein n=1 Tax=Micromonospora sp. DT15 TaxID=3393445 RepID=UPI003CECCF1A